MSDSYSGRSEVKARSRSADPATDGEEAAEEAAARERREMLSARAPAIAMRAIATEAAGGATRPDRTDYVRAPGVARCIAATKQPGLIKTTCRALSLRRAARSS